MSTSYNIQFDANLDVSKIKSAVSSIQSDLNKLNMPSNLAKGFESSAGKIQKTITEIEAAMLKGINDPKAAEGLAKTYEKLGKQLSEYSLNLENIKGLSLENLLPQDSINKINAMEQAVKNYGAAIKEAQGKDQYKNITSSIKQSERDIEKYTDKINNLKIQLSALDETQKKYNNELSSQQSIKDTADQQLTSLKQQQQVLEQTKKYYELQQKIDTKYSGQTKAVGTVRNQIEKLIGDKGTGNLDKDIESATRYFNLVQKAREAGKNIPAASKDFKWIGNFKDKDFSKLEGFIQKYQDLISLKDLKAKANTSIPAQTIDQQTQQIEQSIKEQENIIQEAKNKIGKLTQDLNKTTATSDKTKINLTVNENGLKVAQDELNTLKQKLEQLNQTNASEAFTKIKAELKNLGVQLPNTVTNIEQLQQFSSNFQASEVQKLGQALQTVGNNADKVGDLAQKSDQAATKLRDSAAAAIDFQGQLDGVKSRINYFFSLANAIQLVKKSVREAFNTVKELDAAMTETAVVTDFDVSDMWNQLPKYTKVANELGVTTKGAYETMTLFYQQGLNTQETFEIGTETMKMARIAGLDYATATDYRIHVA